MVKNVVGVLAVLVCAAWSARAEKVTSLSIHVKTANVSLAGTDNDVKVFMITEALGGVPVVRSWNLDTPNHDDFESGNYEGFALPNSMVTRPCEMKRLEIVKSPDDSNGGWKLEFIEIFVNGKLFYKGVANKWLEDESLAWHAADFPTKVCEPPPTPPGINLGTGFPPPKCEVTIIQGSGEFQTEVIEPDADCDGVANKDDGTFSTDNDGDGLCNWCEDFNQNGKVDPGETDPHKEDSDGNGKSDAEELADGDHDGLADIFEDKNRNGVQDDGETNAADDDSDDDGWFDGFANVRSTLYLVKVECLNEQEDVGEDELFLTFNHARWPADEDLDGAWSIEGGDSAEPLLQVARRTAGIGSKLSQSTFSVRIDAREDDVADFTDDDYFLDHDRSYPADGPFSVTHKTESFWDTTHYVFHFQAIHTWFADPSPLDTVGDADLDGVTDVKEAQTTLALGGVGDPEQKDLYLELDSLGAGQVPERYSREDIASRFTYRGFAFHLDDGVFGGGQVLPYEKELTLRDEPPSVMSHRKTDFAASRCGVFRYALAVDVVKVKDESKFGHASRPVKDASGKTLCGFGDILLFESDFFDHVSDLESIVWIHELGHSLALCHLPGDDDPVVGGAACAGQCPPPGTTCHCAHYTNSTWNDSAMGSGVSFPWIDDIIQAIDREIDYADSEWAVVDLTPIKPTICP